MNNSFVDNLKRKTIITGHYGSGKTEFAISIALYKRHTVYAKHSLHLRNSLHLNELGDRFDYPLAIIDFDLVNPYFRSQERRELLESNGIAVYGSAYDKTITAELPALSADVRAPLESDSCRVFIDAGGNDAGALVLNQFSKYFKDDETEMLTVVNANRPDTSDISGILKHIAAIEEVTSLTVSGLVNNTHMLRETTAADITHGFGLCSKICEITGKSLLCNCYPDGIVDPNKLKGFSGDLLPLGLYMRPTWLDK